jgi:hypothetical protein
MLNKNNLLYILKFLFNFILRQFLVILFKDNPFEIWDVKNITLLKRVSKKSPPIKILVIYLQK